MINNFIPTTVVDDFFEDPNWVREYALTLPYDSDPTFAWPGTRSPDLNIINPNFLSFVINKSLSIFYNAGTEAAGQDPRFNFMWDAQANFHLVKKDQGSGWIHKDTALITGIIFLNDSYNPNAGTSIYDIKRGVQCDAENINVKRDFFAGKVSTEQMTPYMKANNSQFEESIRVQNKFNRLLMFDSNLWHGANEYSDDTNSQDGDRLTLTFFIEQFHVRKSPIYRMRNYN